ncbi:MAG: hypothetical protein ACPGR2_16060 [Psychrobium sp.]
MSLKHFCLSIALILAVTGCDYLPKTAQLALNDEQKSQLATQLQPSIQVVNKAFKTKQFVALGDAHYYPGYMSEITKIVTSNKITPHVNKIVVEFGNQKSQVWIDDYIAGKDVDETHLKHVLRETIYFTAWLNDDYLNFFKAIRTENQSRAKDNKINVILAESHFDWNKNVTSQQWESAAQNKVEGFYQQIEPLINSNEKAFLIFGGFHLLSSESQQHSLVDRINKAKPNATFTVWPMIQKVLQHPFEQQENGIISTSETTLAPIHFQDIMPKARFTLSKMDMSDANLQDLVDGFLYVGSNERSLKLPESISKDKLWKDEMQRRVKIIGGKLEDRFNQILNQQ